VVEEGQEIVYKTPHTQSASGGRETSPEEDSAIQDILDRGSDVDDDEIEEATKRLLACTLCPGEIDDIWDNSDIEPGQYSADHDDVEQSDHDDDEDSDGDAESGDDEDEDAAGDDPADSNAPVGYGSGDAADSAPRQEVKKVDDAPPNEMTSLLGNEASGSGSSMASHNEELLRPSIFTTVSDIDVQQRMNFN